MPTTKARSIGTRTATGTSIDGKTISTDATGLIVTISSGGSFNANWGEGDLLKINSDAAFSNGFSDGFDSETWAYVLSRNSATQLTLQTAVTPNLLGEAYSIQRAHSEIASWESDCPANLVADDSIWKGVCYNDSVLTGSSTIAGITTDSTRYIWLTVAEGHKHTGQRYDTSKFRIEPSTYSVPCIDSRASYTLIEWIQIKANNHRITCVTTIAAGSTIATIRNCIFTQFASWQYTVGAVINDDNASIYNCLAYGFDTNGSGLTAIRGKLYNNTVYMTVAGVIGITANVGTVPVIYNNISIAPICFNAMTTADVGYNLSSDATATGTGSLINKVASNQFISLTGGSEDFTLKTTADAAGVGTDLHTTFTNDIANKTRYATWINRWDIGASRPFMTITKSIGATARNYLTITAWESDAPPSLVAEDIIWKGECYNDGIFNEAINIAGILADATRYVWLTTAVGHKHDGKRYVDTGVRITYNHGYTPVIYLNSVAFTVFENLQVSPLGGQPGIYAANGPGERAIIKSCIVYYPIDQRDSIAGIGNTGSDGRVINSLVYAASGKVLKGGISIGYGAKAYNCTVYSSYGTSVSAINLRHNDTVAYNCISLVAGGTAFGTLSTLMDYCMSSDATAYGTHSLINKVASNQFVSLVGGSEDFTIKTTADAANAGADVNTILTTDIAGKTRYSTWINRWDIGVSRPFTIVTKSIGASARDYSTLPTWESACPADIVAEDIIWKGVCYNDSVFTNKVTISGVTVDATRYVWLAGATPIDGKKYSASYTRIKVTDADNSIAVNVSLHYTRITDLQFSNGNNNQKIITADPYVVTISGCLFWGDSTYYGAEAMFVYRSGATFSYVYNNVIYGTFATGGLLAAVTTDGSVYFYNNTMYVVNAAVCLRIKDTNAAHVKNCIIMGGSKCIDYGSTPANASYNITSDTTATGTGSLVSKVATNQFISVTLGSEDFSLKAGSDAWRSGTHLGTVLSTDVRNVSRNYVFDIGAFSSTVIKARSIGTKATYNTGTLTVNNPYQVTLAGGTFDTTAWGDGDVITIDGEVCYVEYVSSSAVAYLKTPTTKTGSGLAYSIARTYSTMTTWESASPASLVTDDSIWKGVCYNDSNFNEQLSIAGITTDTTRYAWLTSADTQWHKGSLSTGVVIDRAAQNGNVITSTINNVIIEKIRITNVLFSSPSPARNGVVSLVSAGTNTVVRNMAIHDCVAGNVSNMTVTGIDVNNAGANVYVYNCLLARFTGASFGTNWRGIIQSNGGASVRIFNCTAYQIYVAYATYGTTIKGCIGLDPYNDYQGNAGVCFFSSFIQNSSNNLSTDASALGTLSVISVASSTVVTSTAGSDFSLVSGSPAIGKGVNNATIYTKDIVDNNRSFTWDMGAFRTTTGKYWVGGTTDWNTGANWSNISGGAGGAGVPTAAEDAIFDTGSNGFDCTATASMICMGINATGWTKNFNTAGFALTTNALCSMTGTGALAFTNSTLNLYGGITVASTAASLNWGSCIINFNYTADWTIGKAPVTYIKKFTVASGVTCSIRGVLDIRDDGADGALELAGTGTVMNVYGNFVNIRSGGNCKPVVDNGNTMFFSTGWLYQFLPETQGAIRLPKISNVSVNIFLKQAKIGETQTYEMSDTIYANRIYVGNNSQGNHTTIFNTKNYGLILTYRLFVEATSFIAPSTIRLYYGSSTISMARHAFTCGVGSTIEVNLESCNITFSADDNNWTTTGSLVLNAGTSTVTFAGSTLATYLVSAGKVFNNVVVNMNHATNTFSFNDALNCNRLQIEPKTIVRFKEDVTHTIANYTAGDWDGTAVNPVTIKSITDGQQHTLQVPTGIITNYVNVRDSIASNPIAAWSNTNTNSGNNTQWLFAVPAAGELVNQNCLISGEAFHSGGGVGNIINKATVIYGEGLVVKVGSGSIVNKASEVSGSGSVRHMASGVLLCSLSEINGSGSSSHTCSGVLINRSVLVSGSGAVCHRGSGAIVSYLPISNGAGHEGGEAIGGLVNKLPEVSGSGRVCHVSSGSTTNQKPIIIGQGLDLKVSSGSLLSSAPTVNGSGNVSHVSSGNIVNQLPTISSSASVYHIGFGSLVSYKNQTNGSGNVIHSSTGELSSQLGILYGEGSVVHAGSGELNNRLPALEGEGISGYAGKGVLLNGLPFVVGNGYVLSIHVGEGKPIRIKCLYNSYARTTGRMPTQGTVRALYSSNVHLKCYLNLAEWG